MFFQSNELRIKILESKASALGVFLESKALADNIFLESKALADTELYNKNELNQ